VDHGVQLVGNPPKRKNQDLEEEKTVTSMEDSNYHYTDILVHLAEIIPAVTVTAIAETANKHTHTHITILLLFWNMSGTTRVSRYQKGKARKVKTNLDLLEQEIVSGSGICRAICKSAPHPR